MNLRLVIAPAIITFAVTLLRLTGELRHWPEKWFSTSTSGIVPMGTSWVVGITWLAAVFGAYFAIRLFRSGQGPKSLGKPAIFAGMALMIYLLYYPAIRFLIARSNIGFPHYLLFIWFFWLVAGVLPYFGWPQLFKVLLTYAYAARIPVAIVMFFAMRGHWGTHYDYVGMDIPLSGLPRYLWMAFFPQLVAWVAFTIALGSVVGLLAISLIRLSGLFLRKKINQIDVTAAP